ncbi:hypothetical protein BDZ89DRAFT_1072026 [Hymenopellis radicata]|nr:hypothetical protein BDZ89DRAFT_1072026 [Hymenopellis radicata]
MECPNCHENIYHSHLAEYQAILTETHHLKELRTTNNPASSGELGYVYNELLPAIENDRRELEKRISELRVAVELLAEEKQSLTGLVDGIKSLISPRRRLPPELLMEIFNYACARDWDWDHCDWSLNPHSPYVLTQVCSGWRQVALSCPAIWSHITHRPAARRSRSYIESVGAALARSGTFPLCIEMASFKRGHESAVQAFLERVSTQSFRWRTLKLWIGWNFFGTAFNLLRRPYPLVDRLDVDIQNAEGVSVPQTGFSQYPSLRTIVLHDCRMITTDLPWAQITTLLISPTFVQWTRDCTSYYQVLRHCPSLQTLVTASELTPLLLMPDPTSTMTLKDLKCLETSFEFILDHLCLPRLEVARLSTGRDQRQRDSDELKSMVASFEKLLRRSMCPSRLHSLYIKKIPITEELLSLLSLTQNLVTLNIRAKMVHTTDLPEGDPEAMQTITSLVDMLEVKHGEDPSFLPQLQHISISLSRHLDKYSFRYLGNQERLVRTLQSRWNVGNHPGLERLKTFEYRILAHYINATSFSFPRLTSETEAALRLLEDEGMRISIRVRSKLVKSDKLYVLDFGRHYA